MNPELQRNLWLECEAQRFILTALVLVGFFSLLAALIPEPLRHVISTIALAVFTLTTVLWGSHRAGDSILDEQRDKTWEIQKMSAIYPWQMTWGKLLGATILPWFCGLISLSAYLVFTEHHDSLRPLKTILIALGVAITFHSLSVVGGLVMLKANKQTRSTLISWASIVALAMIWSYFSLYRSGTGQIKWYGYRLDSLDFLLFSVAILAFWMVFGAYRLMCDELNVRTLPWAWLGFLTYLVLFFVGGRLTNSTVIEPTTATLFRHIGSIGLALSLGAAYLTAFLLPRDQLAFRRLRLHLNARRWRRFGEEMPLWLVSILTGIVCVVINIAFYDSTQGINPNTLNLGISAIGILLYALRDVCLLFYFSFSRSARRPESACLISLALLYWIAPGLFSAVNLEPLAWLLRPRLWENPATAILVIAVQAIVIGFFALSAYRSASINSA